MVDSTGRVIDYLRLSVTDRCNLRCVYCMPPEGAPPCSHNDILRYDELIRLCAILAGMGIRKIKVTGGEPLVRRGVSGLLASLKAIPGIEQVTMTTNGLLLDGALDELAAAGLDAVNISLDALDAETYRRITRRDGPHTALAALDHALRRGIPVKVNCVPIRSLNKTDLIAVAGLAENRDIAVRFIELMPLGRARGLEPVPQGELLSMLENRYGPLRPLTGVFGNGPAVYYGVRGFAGKIGFISAVTRCFCVSCNRLRLTAAGLLKPCLADDGSLDMRELLRRGAADSELAGAIAELVSRKPAGHRFAEGGGPAEMFRVGG